MQDFAYNNIMRVPQLQDILPTMPKWFAVRGVKVLLIIFPCVALVFLFAKLHTRLHTTTSSPDDDTTDYSDLFTYNNIPPGSNTLNPPLRFNHSNFYGDERLLAYEHLFKPRKNKITPMNFKFLIKAKSLCERREAPTLLVMVMSLPMMKRQRQAIRATWGSIAVGHPWPDRKLEGTMKLIFLFGNTYNNTHQKVLLEESALLGDIVQADFKESYFNFTYKVLMGFRWAERYCPGARFIMKTDDDTFFNVPYIMNLLKTRQLNNTIYGPFFYVDSVSRTSKYRVDPEAYAAPVYPPHVKGNMYIMPLKLAVNIAHVAEYMPYVNIEDAYITGVLAKLFDARHLAIDKTVYRLRKPSKKCDLALGKKMISQQVYENSFFRIWERIIDKNMCKNGRYI